MDIGGELSDGCKWFFLVFKVICILLDYCYIDYYNEYLNIIWVYFCDVGYMIVLLVVCVEVYYIF